MTSKALIKTAELTRLAGLAKAENVTVEMERDGVTIRVMPFHGAVGTSQDDRASALDKWKSESGWSSGESKVSNEKRGQTSPDDILKKYYDDLGFDPKSMNDTDLQRLQSEADAKWKASIPGTPLTNRERAVLEQLAAHGSGHKIDGKHIKHCGPDTQDRLMARGFLETSGSKKFPDRPIYLELTGAGFEAWKGLPRED